MLLVVAALLTTFCSSGDAGTRNLDGITLEVARERMVTALFVPDGVMHTNERIEPKDENQVVTPQQDIWRSAATGEARIESGEARAVIFADGAQHTLDGDGTVRTVPYERLDENRALLGLAQVLFSSAADSARLQRDEVDGIDTIRIDVLLPTGDGTGEAKIYLDEDRWLPIRIEYPRLTALYEHEVVVRDSLAAEFFSPESLEGAPEADE
jgi:hypothetical protein